MNDITAADINGLNNNEKPDSVVIAPRINCQNLNFEVSDFEGIEPTILVIPDDYSKYDNP